MPLAVCESDPAAGRAAVWVEADVADIGPATFASDGKELDRQICRELTHRPCADAVTAGGDVEIEGDRPVARDRLRPSQAQSRGELGRRSPQPEPTAPGRFVTCNENQRQAENG